MVFIDVFKKGMETLSKQAAKQKLMNNETEKNIKSRSQMRVVKETKKGQETASQMWIYETLLHRERM